MYISFEVNFLNKFFFFCFLKMTSLFSNSHFQYIFRPNIKHSTIRFAIENFQHVVVKTVFNFDFKTMSKA